MIQATLLAVTWPVDEDASELTGNELSSCIATYQWYLQ